MFKVLGIRRISRAFVLEFCCGVVSILVYSVQCIVPWTARHSPSSINKMRFNFVGIRLQSIDELLPCILLPNSNSIQDSASKLKLDGLAWMGEEGPAHPAKASAWLLKKTHNMQTCRQARMWEMDFRHISLTFFCCSISETHKEYWSIRHNI